MLAWASFILIIYSYHPGETAVYERNAQLIHLYGLPMTLLCYKFAMHTYSEISRRYIMKTYTRLKCSDLLISEVIHMLKFWELSTPNAV